MNSYHIPDSYICHNWFDISYDLDYTIAERCKIVSKFAGRYKVGMIKLGVL